jgi:hypothetical protein
MTAACGPRWPRSSAVRARPPRWSARTRPSRRLVDYTEIGCDLLSIRGWDVWNDAHDYARHVLPLVRQELAHRQATGTAPVLNPDSKPASEPKLALA